MKIFDTHFHIYNGALIPTASGQAKPFQQISLNGKLYFEPLLVYLVLLNKLQKRY